MLYVFQVDNGSMLILDMQLALGTVGELKEGIFQETKIPCDKQVLLISGGEALQSDQDVSQYSAGTDTNPIFLFSMSAIEAMTSNIVDYYPAPQFKEKVENALQLQPSYKAVVFRAQLAKQLYDHTREQTKICQDLVHSQHLQQQGWAAVVASLEDVLKIINEQYDTFKKLYNDYLQSRSRFLYLINNSEKDLELLQRIPILSSLKQSFNAENFPQAMKPDTSLSEEAASRISPEESIKLESHSTLLSLFCENMDKAKVMIEECCRNLEKFDDSIVQTLGDNMNQIVKITGSIKEIIGLEERLSFLEELMTDAQKIVAEQKCYADSFQQNQASAERVNDPSIYPDLSHNHIQTLSSMHNMYQRVRDIKNRCLSAKANLSKHIIGRLGFIHRVQSSVKDLFGEFTFYKGNIKRILSRIAGLEQIHQAPALYLSALAEVARRQNFSQNFFQWTRKLSFEVREIYEKEVDCREKFNKMLSTHCLLELFRCLEDFPSNYATQDPGVFDERLPKLTNENLEMLREKIPELAHLLVIPETVAVPPLLQNFFQTNGTNTTLTPSSNSALKDGSNGEEDEYASAVTLSESAKEDEEKGKISSSQTCFSRHTALTRDQPESETDTEEFEKVCCSTSDGTYSPMEADPDPRGNKTKQHFHSHRTDSKHIKLDSSQDTEEQNKRLHLEYTSTDESYTDTSVTTTTNSGAASLPANASYIQSSDGKSNRVNLAELQKQMDEKDASLLDLQNDLTSSRNEVEALQKRLNALSCFKEGKALECLKVEVERLKEEVREDGNSYLNFISQFSSKLLKNLEQIQIQTATDKDTAITDAIKKTKLEQETAQNELKSHLELKSHQLSDAYKEIDMYQDQITRQLNSIQQMTCEFEEIKAVLIAEKDEAIRKINLDHELEMELIGVQWKDEHKKKDDELKLLEEKVLKIENLLSKVESERDKLNSSFEERYLLRFEEDKEKIVQILESSFSERERKTCETVREQLEETHKNQILVLKNEKKDAINKLYEEFNTKLEEALLKERKDIEKHFLEKEKKDKISWENEKELEILLKLGDLEEELNDRYRADLEKAKHAYKMDLEALRSRFRMMTTASMEQQSPPESNLMDKFAELQKGGDYVTVTVHEDALQKLKIDLEKEKEDALVKLKENHSETLQEEIEKCESRLKNEFKRIEFEKQEEFTKTICGVTQDKERVMEDFRLRINLLTGENERLLKLMNQSDDAEHKSIIALNQNLKDQCDLHKREIDRLEKELVRAKRMSFVSEKFPSDLESSFSDGGSDNPAVAKLQAENQDLKNTVKQLTNSDKPKVSLHSCNSGEIVLFVWDEFHAHYRVLLEGQLYLHFLHSDSYAALGLSKEEPHKMFCTAEVVKTEYCQAKKDENRFRVARGTKFGRVIAIPYEHKHPKESTPAVTASSSPRQRRANILGTAAIASAFTSPQRAIPSTSSSKTSNAASSASASSTVGVSPSSSPSPGTSASAASSCPPTSLSESLQDSSSNAALESALEESA